MRDCRLVSGAAASRCRRARSPAACDRLRHRGPDDAGYFIDGDFGFGMRRLSIIDVEGGHQPIFSPDGRHAIVFNGEIYNHPELRRELDGGLRLPDRP